MLGRAIATLTLRVGEVKHPFQIKCEQKGKQAGTLTRCDVSGIVPSAKSLLLCERNGAA
jgi:hypothetical protein